MKILFIGGTGTISTAISRKLMAEGEDLYLLNRGHRNHVLGEEGVTYLVGDIRDEARVQELLGDHTFDVVANFIAFQPEEVERDVRLFQGRTRQYIFVSSASAYQKPLSHPVIDEGTPLSNPHWAYSRNKMACEERLLHHYRTTGFPVTIVRPSHTYDERKIPVGVHGDHGSWQVAKRMREGKPVIIHGDGSALWTVTHSSDFAEGFCGLLGNLHALGEAVQIMSEESLTWNQIYQALADALGVELKPYYIPSDFLDAVGPYDFKGGLLGDKAHTVVFDIAKLKRLVPGFHARVRFDQGIRRTIAHLQAHPELQKEDPDFDVWCDRVIQAMEKAKRDLQGD